LNDRSPLVVIALGSNLGDSEGILNAALDRLRELAGRPLRVSSFVRTAPVDCPPGSPDFLNAVAAFHAPAGMTSDSLLASLQSLEREFGRQPKRVLNEARPLDLDIIAFGAEERRDPALTIPHPRATQRRFVLGPLAEILPGFRAPGWPAAAAELARNLPGDGERPAG